MPALPPTRGGTPCRVRGGSVWLLCAAFLVGVVFGGCSSSDSARMSSDTEEGWTAPGGRLLYLAGKRSLRIYAIDEGHRLLQKIMLPGGKKIRGIVASAQTRRLYVSYDDSLACLDLTTHKMIWIRSYDSGTDRMAITPDGATIYLPSGSKRDTSYWYVVDATSGVVVSKLEFHDGAHNTIAGPDGRLVYLSSRKHNKIAVASTETNTVIREVGPFGDVVRPFTIDAAQSLVFVNVDDLLGFEIGSLTTGKVLHRVEVADYAMGPVKRHNCPSHGIGMTPDGGELWLADAANQRLHVFDIQTLPPAQVASIELSDEPYWITFSIDGHFAYPSTGDVIDVASREIVGTLRKNSGGRVRSEKILEIDVRAGVPALVGDQFGVGRR